MQIQDQLVTLRGDQPNSRSVSTVLSSSPATPQLRASSYCIFVKLPKRPDQVLLVHGYTGAYDEVSLDVAEFLHSRRTVSMPLYGKWSAEFERASESITLSDETLNELENRGYLTTLTVEEEKERLRSIAGLVHSLETKALNYILVPGYDCNLRCPYCFQDYMRTDPSFKPLLKRMNKDLVDRILDGIPALEAEQAGGTSERRQFTLFGGEPLLAANFEIVEYILRRASAMGPCTFGAITNGTELELYRDLLGPDGISSVQITLDGPPRAHDRFRIYEDGAGSFERIARNMVMALERGVSVSVRVNVCKDNLDDLPNLAREAKQRGWTNYENFQIYAAPIQPTGGFRDDGRLLNSRELGLALRKLRETNTDVAMIETADDTMKERALQLFRHAEIDPVSDFKASFCGAHSGMYVFDPFGDIYACWEKMGDPGIRIGRVAAEGNFIFQTPMLTKWRSRTIASNPTCESCAYSLQCGGGCAVLAEARNGEYFSNFCDGFGARFKRAVADAYESHLAEQEDCVAVGGPGGGTADVFHRKPGCL